MLREVQLQVAHLGNSLCVAYRLRDLRPQLGHLLRTLEVVGVLLHLHAAFVVYVRVGVYADEDILERRLFLQGIVRIVGGHDGDLQLSMKLHESLVDYGQVRDSAVLHELQEIALAEQLPIIRHRLPGPVHVALGDGPGHLAAGAARHHDQALVVPLQDFSVYSRFVVISLEVRFGHELDEVLVALRVLCKDGDVVRALVIGVPTVAAALGDVHLAADDRLDLRGLRLLIEFDDAVHSSVVGDGKAVHAQCFGPVDQGFEAAETIEQAEFGVDVKVGEQGASGRKVLIGRVIIAP